MPVIHQACHAQRWTRAKIRRAAGSSSFGIDDLTSADDLRPEENRSERSSEMRRASLRSSACLATGWTPRIQSIRDGKSRRSATTSSVFCTHARTPRHLHNAVATHARTRLHARERDELTRMNHGPDELRKRFALIDRYRSKRPRRR